MPRFFFHTQDGQDWTDEVGTTLAGVDEARALAITASAEALRDLGAKFWGHPDWRMHVTDEQGATVCDLHFRNQSGAD